MVGVGDLQLDFTLHALVNDALMAIFCGSEKYVVSCAYAAVDGMRLDEYDYRRNPGPI